jgi:hypothetical protein
MAFVSFYSFPFLFLFASFSFFITLHLLPGTPTKDIWAFRRLQWTYLPGWFMCVSVDWMFGAPQWSLPVEHYKFTERDYSIMMVGLLFYSLDSRGELQS